jgi:hypothetical protein
MISFRLGLPLTGEMFFTTLLGFNYILVYFTQKSIGAAIPNLKRAGKM